MTFLNPQIAVFSIRYIKALYNLFWGEYLSYFGRYFETVYRSFVAPATKCVNFFHLFTVSADLAYKDLQINASTTMCIAEL